VFLFAGFHAAVESLARPLPRSARRELATAGPYRLVRHPQYIGFVLIMFGFLLQWPTLLDAGDVPCLGVMYVRLAISERAGLASSIRRRLARPTQRQLRDSCPISEDQPCTTLAGSH